MLVQTCKIILDVTINMPPFGSLITLVAIGRLTAMHYASYIHTSPVQTTTVLKGTTHIGVVAVLPETA
jgi:hypothetical protein